MKNFIVSALLTCLCIGSASAGPSQASSGDATDIAAIKQLGKDIGDAMIDVDIDRLNRIFADDWSSVASPGKAITREGMLRDFKSGKDKLEAFELGPMDVQVFGDVGVVHGSVTEKRTRDGQETSGRFVYMDLVERRDGRWVVVRSAGARVK